MQQESPNGGSELAGSIWVFPKSSMSLHSDGNVELDKRDCIYLVTS